MALKIHATSRGYRRALFADRYGEGCSIQESSAFAGQSSCILLGKHRDGYRMHLTQEMAADLIPLLQHFVETGGLPNGEVSS